MSLEMIIYLLFGIEKLKVILSTNIVKIFFNHILILQYLFYYDVDYPENFYESIIYLTKFIPNIIDSLSIDCLLYEVHWNIK